jgi:uncharacterized protein with HEPN domain
MRERQRTDRTLVDLMLREAEAAAVYTASGREEYLEAGTEGMHLRDGLWRHVLQFLESGTKLGRPFRNANPNVPWELIEELRQDMTHDYPEVSPEAVRAFAVERMPGIVRKLRRARFPVEPR